MILNWIDDPVCCKIKNISEIRVNLKEKNLSWTASLSKNNFLLRRFLSSHKIIQLLLQLINIIS